MYIREYQSADVFTAVVITTNSGTGIVTVIRESYGGGEADFGFELQGIPLASTMATYLGFKESCMPQPGSRVVCIKFASTHCYIVGVIPEEALGGEAIPLRGMLGAGDASSDSANNQGLSDRVSVITDLQKPSDVVDGEHVVSNEFGVLLGLYQQLANLKGSELSQIQCFLLDDLVRIISHNFQHYTALGEYNIYHDGKRIMAEFGATHLPKESYGSVDSPTFQKEEGASKDDSKDHYKIEGDERVKAIERFKIFLGGLGDFLHIFLVKPGEEVRKLDPGSSISKPDRGLFNMHIGTDGALHLRSLKEVFIEKTNWIRVPVRKAAPDDPQGDDAEKLKYEEKKKFEFDDSLKYLGNPFAYSLQLKDYVAYVNEKLAYQNFKTHEKDFDVNDSIGKEKKIPEIDEIDKETKLNLSNYQLRTAGIYLMPNGGVTIRDAWNSSIVLEGGNIYLQPAKDLMSLPLRHNIVKAGDSVSIVSRNHMDLSSTEEGIRVKADTSAYIYSDRGGIVLESAGVRNTPGTPNQSEEDPEKLAAIDYIGGVVIKSTLGIYNYTAGTILNYTRGDFYIEAKDGLFAVCDNMVLFGKKSFMILAKKSLDVFSKVRTTIISMGRSIFGGIGSTWLGMKDQRLSFKAIPKYGWLKDPPQGIMDLKKYVDTREVDKKMDETYDTLISRTIFKKEKEGPDWHKFTDLKFRFLKSIKYNLEPDDCLVGSLAQQDDMVSNSLGLEAWEEKEMNETMPFPGKEKGEEYYLEPITLTNLEKSPSDSDLVNKAESKEKMDEELKKVSLFTEYKVQKS
jgi:hypothetical protein